jgi:hypothetical protein
LSTPAKAGRAMDAHSIHPVSSFQIGSLFVLVCSKYRTYSCSDLEGSKQQGTMQSFPIGKSRPDQHTSIKIFHAPGGRSSVSFGNASDRDNAIGKLYV